MCPPGSRRPRPAKERPPGPARPIPQRPGRRRRGAATPEFETVSHALSMRSGSLLEQNPNVMQVVVGALAVGHERPQISVPVDQVRERRMGERRLAAERLLAGGNPIVLPYRGQL